MLTSCQVEPSSTPTPTPSGSEPALPAIADYSVQYLNDPMRELAQAVENARNSVLAPKPDLDAARMALFRATDLATHLNDFYLPVTAARDHLVEAYEAQVRGDSGQRDKHLEAAAERLTWVVEQSPAPVSNYANELLTALTALELHERTSTTITNDLRSLCETTQTHLLKAPLVLNGEDEKPTP
jgi:hypothetical protein